MKLCYVCDEYPPASGGGIGTITQTIARAMHKLGHTVHVIGTYPHGHTNLEHEDDCGVQVWRLSSGQLRGSWVLDRFRLYRRLSRWAKSKEIDLVEVPDWAGVAAGWPRLSVPVVTRIHGSSSFFQREMGSSIDGLTWRLERSSIQRSNALCAVSRYAAEKTTDLYNLKQAISVLYNPIASAESESFEFNRQEGRTREKDLVVFAGTLVKKKGIISLIYAWENVIKALPTARLHIYGRDGKAPNGGSMQQFLINELSSQAKQSVTFFGQQTRIVVEKALRVARVGVYPSFAESFGAAPLESMACGCPTIYSKLGPGPELLRDSIEALLIDPSQAHQIADAIIRLIVDDDFAYSLGEAGAKRVGKAFSLDNLMEQNLRFYHSALVQFGSSEVAEELSQSFSSYQTKVK